MVKALGFDPDSRILLPLPKYFADIAQLVELLPSKQTVVGSSPTIRSNFTPD